MRSDSGVLAVNRRPLQLHGVHKGQRIGDPSIDAAHQLQIEPDPRQPRRQIGEQGAADSPRLLYIQHAAAQQPYSDEKQGDGQDQPHRRQQPDVEGQPQQERHAVGDQRLQQGDGEDGEQIAEDKVRRCQGCGI